MFLKEGKIFYKMVTYTLCLDSVNHQKSRWKVSRRKTDFFERGLALKNKILKLLQTSQNIFTTGWSGIGPKNAYLKISPLLFKSFLNEAQKTFNDRNPGYV